MNRIAPLLLKYNLSNPADLITFSKQDIKIKIDIVNALTTNETWFFRHPEHFDILKNNVLPKIIKRKKDKVINIWSAGCSIGAELYSILITIMENVPFYKDLRINIIGSDISYDAVQIAKKGIYDRNDLRTTDRSIIYKYFDQQEDGLYKVKDELKRYVTFEFLNLLETWAPRTFDIIFCRNTMIYFNEEAKSKLIKRFFRALELEGYFFTSANELIDIEDENYGFKKIFLKNDFIYKKTNKTVGTSELYFKTPTDLLRATNLLRKNSYNFQYGLPQKNSLGNNIRNIIVSKSEYDKIIKLLLFNSIETSKESITFR